MVSCISSIPNSSKFIDFTSLFDVNVDREGYAVVMSGVDSSYNAYVHGVDPVLALNFTGENSNATYLCRALSSLLFGEIESQALNLSGRESNSSVSIIFSEILNGADFTLNYTNGILTIQLTGNENYTFIFDVNTGLVYDLTNYENFTYKGAISCDSNGNCPYLFAYIVVGNFYEAIRYKGDLTYHGQEYRFSNETKHIITSVLTSLALGSAMIIIGDTLPYIGLLALGVSAPVLLPLLVAGGLIAGAYVLNYYDNGCNSDRAMEETIIGLISAL